MEKTIIKTAIGIDVVVEECPETEGRWILACEFAGVRNEAETFGDSQVAGAYHTLANDTVIRALKQGRAVLDPIVWFSSEDPFSAFYSDAACVEHHASEGRISIVNGDEGKLESLPLGVLRERYDNPTFKVEVLG